MKKLVDGVLIDMTHEEIEAANDASRLHAVPQSVSMRQARLALLAAGMLDDIDTAIASIPGDAGRAAKIQWEYATEVRRDNQLIAIVQTVQGMMDEQVDALFREAAKL